MEQSKQSQNKKQPTQGVHDDDLDLGYILHHSDAPTLGAHPFVSDLLRPKPKLRGTDAPAQFLPGGSSGGGSSAQGQPGGVSGGGSSTTESNDSGGLNSQAIRERESHPGPATDTGAGYRRSNSAGAESDAAHESRQ